MYGKNNSFMSILVLIVWETSVRLIVAWNNQSKYISSGILLFRRVLSKAAYNVFQHKNGLFRATRGWIFLPSKRRIAFAGFCTNNLWIYQLRSMFGCIQPHEDLHFSNVHVVKFYLLSQNRGSESIWKVPVSCEQKDNPLIGTVISCGVSVTSSCLLKGTFIVQRRWRLWPCCPKQTHSIRCHWSNPHQLDFISSYVIWLFSFFVCSQKIIESSSSSNYKLVKRPPCAQTSQFQQVHMFC